MYVCVHEHPTCVYAMVRALYGLLIRCLPR